MIKTYQVVFLPLSHTIVKTRYTGQNVHQNILSLSVLCSQTSFPLNQYIKLERQERGKTHSYGHRERDRKSGSHGTLVGGTYSKQKNRIYNIKQSTPAHRSKTTPFIGLALDSWLWEGENLYSGPVLDWILEIYIFFLWTTSKLLWYRTHKLTQSALKHDFSSNRFLFISDEHGCYPRSVLFWWVQRGWTWIFYFFELTFSPS